MKYRFITCYAIENVNLPRERGDVDLPIGSATGASATLTLEPDHYLSEADRRSAVRNLMMRSFLGDERGGVSSAEGLDREVAAIRAIRKEETRSKLFLIFKGEGEVASFCPSNQRETDDFVVCFGGADSDAIRRGFEPAVSSAKASLITMTTDLPKFRHVCDAIVFLREDGKQVYSYTFSGSAEASVSRPLPDRAAETFEERYRGLSAAHSASISKAIRLYESQPHGWVELYRLYEVIEGDVGGLDEIAERKWAARDRIRNFKHTACSPGAVGDAARHGHENTLAPRNPMSLREARELVEDLFQKWLSSKAAPIT